MARIAIDPDLWRKVRVRAFEEGISGAEIVNEALRQYLAAPRVSPLRQPGPRRAAKPETEKRVGDADASHVEAPPVAAAPPDKEDPWKDLAKPKLISTPEEAKAAMADRPAIRPVPKPTSKRSRTRSRSDRSTGQPEP